MAYFASSAPAGSPSIRLAGSATAPFGVTGGMGQEAPHRSRKLGERYHSGNPLLGTTSHDKEAVRGRYHLGPHQQQAGNPILGGEHKVAHRGKRQVDHRADHNVHREDHDARAAAAGAAELEAVPATGAVPAAGVTTQRINDERFGHRSGEAVPGVLPSEGSHHQHERTHGAADPLASLGYDALSAAPPAGQPSSARALYLHNLQARSTLSNTPPSR